MPASSRFLALIAPMALLCSPLQAQEEAKGPAANGETGSILVYSRTAGWRHDSIDEAWAAIAAIANKRGWSVTFAEDESWFDASRLANFDAVVFALSSGNTLSPDRRSNFRSFVENGGGFVGLHSSGDGTMEWDWYERNLIGAKFIGHPLQPGERSGTIRIEDFDNPATRHLSADWYRVDEWYSFDTSVRGRFNVLASLDEDSYRPGRWHDGTPLAMGSDHPVVWNRCVDRGRSFYSALGHTADSYREDAMIEMIDGGISWALGEGKCPETTG